jgi:NTP pyrophosphatase (non-canonical NTP hydrolase)
MMDFDTYQEESLKTAKGVADPDAWLTRTDRERKAMFLALALNGEAGELAEDVKKYVRETDESYLDDAKSELGDVLWYIAQLATLLDVSLDDVAEDNLDKLLDRQDRDVLHGDGDER